MCIVILFENINLFPSFKKYFLIAHWALGIALGMVNSVGNWTESLPPTFYILFLKEHDFLAGSVHPT